MKIREVRTHVLRHELPEAEVFGSSKGWHATRQALLVGGQPDPRGRALGSSWAARSAARCTPMRPAFIAIASPITPRRS